MSRMKLLVGTVMALGVGLGMSATSARADIIMSPIAVTVTTTPPGDNGTLTGWGFSIAIPQWTTSLAGVNSDCLGPDTCTLTGVELQITSTATGNVDFMAQSVNGSYTNSPSIESNIFFTDPWGNFEQTSAAAMVCGSGVTRTDTSNSDAVPCTVGSSGYGLYLGFPQTVDVALISAAVGNYDSGNQTTNISQFSTGIVNINGGSTQSAVTGTDNNDVATTPNLTADITGDVIFTYSDEPPLVPEPATLSLLGMGLIGLAAARRRGRKSAG